MQFSEVNSVLQVILKIIKHCQEFSPALVTGQLLGLDVGSVLEVTNCFPFPVGEFCSLFLLIYTEMFLEIIFNIFFHIHFLRLGRKMRRLKPRELIISLK